MRIVKRYQNRKFYDTKDSQYVTLQQLGDIMQNDDVQVIDNKSKNDITYQTKLRVLFDRQRNSDNTNNQLVTNILKTNQTLTEYIANLEKRLD